MNTKTLQNRYLLIIEMEMINRYRNRNRNRNRTTPQIYSLFADFLVINPIRINSNIDLSSTWIPYSTFISLTTPHPQPTLLTPVPAISLTPRMATHNSLWIYRPRPAHVHSLGSTLLTHTHGSSQKKIKSNAARSGTTHLRNLSSLLLNCEYIIGSSADYPD